MRSYFNRYFSWVNTPVGKFDASRADSDTELDETFIKSSVNTYQSWRIVQWFTWEYPQLAFLTMKPEFPHPYVSQLECGGSPFYIVEEDKEWRLEQTTMQRWKKLEEMLRTTRNIMWEAAKERTAVHQYTRLPPPEAFGYQEGARTEKEAQKVLEADQSLPSFNFIIYPNIIWRRPRGPMPACPPSA